MNPRNRFKDSVKCITATLIESPTFAMSLGAKELFHTNFLAFLLETTDKSIVSVTRILKKRLLGNRFEGEVMVLREKNNFDLVVLPKSAESAAEYSSIIIEAKMKSIPTREQLNIYSGKIANGFKVEINDASCIYAEIAQNGARYRLLGKDGERCWREVRKPARKILLAPTQPFEEESWEFMEWGSLAADMKEGLNLDREDEKHALCRNIVRSYTNDLDCLIELLKKADEFVDIFCRDNSFLLFGEFNDAMKESFQKLRIHDLVSKYAYWRLSEKLTGFVEGAKIKIDFTNGTPLLHIWKSMGNPKYKIGVQIQGTHYRHFVESKSKDDLLKEFLNDGEYLKKWFNQIMNDSSEEIKSVENLNRFDASKFLYSKINIAACDYINLTKRLNKSFVCCPN